jgi:hypothetical protein
MLFSYFLQFLTILYYDIFFELVGDLLTVFYNFLQLYIYCKLVGSYRACIFYIHF